MRRVLLAALVLLFGLAGCASGSASPATTVTETVTVTASPESTPAPSPTASTTSQGTSGLPTVPLSSLPPQAQLTYTLIEQGGPFPYRQDDAVFGNREGILPDEDYGWYREYTVVTPGSGDRGPRRFVVGQDGTYFYTDDHYNSFSEVIP